MDIKDIKMPLDIPSQWTWLWVVLMVVIVLGGIIWLVVVLLRRPKKEEVIVFPQVSSWQKAYARLENLRLKKLIERPFLKPFYVELSDICRHYLEERFCIPAPEMTTEEFLESLKVSTVLNGSQKQILQEFLATCDMVKFAQYQPSMAEAQRSFELIKLLIDQTHGI